MYSMLVSLLLLCPSEPEGNRYPLTLSRVVDGDTVVGDISLPLSVTLEEQRVRVLGVDTWELKTPTKEQGGRAKQYTEEFLERGTVWLILSAKKERDSFGRVLAEVWVYDGKSWANLATELIKNGHGEKR